MCCSSTPPEMSIRRCGRSLILSAKCWSLESIGRSTFSCCLVLRWSKLSSPSSRAPRLSGAGSTSRPAGCWRLCASPRPNSTAPAAPPSRAGGGPRPSVRTSDCASACRSLGVWSLALADRRRGVWYRSFHGGDDVGAQVSEVSGLMTWRLEILGGPARKVPDELRGRGTLAPHGTRAPARRQRGRPRLVRGGRGWLDRGDARIHVRKR
jgi:hypothetical protein